MTQQGPDNQEGFERTEWTLVDELMLNFNALYTSGNWKCDRQSTPEVTENDRVLRKMFTDVLGAHNVKLGDIASRGRMTWGFIPAENELTRLRIENTQCRELLASKDEMLTSQEYQIEALTKERDEAWEAIQREWIDDSRFNNECWFCGEAVGLPSDPKYCVHKPDCIVLKASKP
jgi:hypothetical protein